MNPGWSTPANLDHSTRRDSTSTQFTPDDIAANPPSASLRIGRPCDRHHSALTTPIAGRRPMMTDDTGRSLTSLPPTRPVTPGSRRIEEEKTPQREQMHSSNRTHTDDAL